MRIIGITGGVGSGKSSVLYELQSQYQAYIIEADKLAHTLMQPGEKIYNAIIEAFGDSILSSKKPFLIDRKKLGEIVFGNKEQLERLNRMVHPIVKEAIINEIACARKNGTIRLFVIEAALLIEDGYKEICDELWYVWVSKKTRIKRLMEQRNYSREQCLSIMQSQSSDDYYKNNTDVQIDNEKDFMYTSMQIKARLNKLL